MPTDHDALIASRGKEIAQALEERPNPGHVASSLGVPLSTVLIVKRQLPASLFRAKSPIPLRYSDEVMAETLRHHASKDGSLTITAYKRRRRKRDPSIQLYLQRWSSWNEAIRFAGLSPTKGSYQTGVKLRFTEQDCIDAIHDCAKTLDKTPSYLAYGKWAKSAQAPSAQTVRNRLGSWLEALAAAGL